MNKKHRKPTGEMNVYQMNEDGVSNLKTFQFPDTKELIEEKIAKLFLKLINKIDIPELMNLLLKQNHEYDLDFSLISDKNEFLLELTEITPPNMKGFSKLKYDHNVGEHAQKTIDLFQKKSDKYSSISTKIILLAYITDDRSQPSLKTEEIIKQYLTARQLSFEYVFLLFPLMENDGIVIKLYPNTAEPLSDVEINNLKKNTVYNLKLN